MTSAEQTAPAFRLKGNLLAVTLLELTSTDPAQIQQQLAAKVASAPGFFNNTPLIISLEGLDEGQPAIDLPALLQICRDNRLLPLAARAVRAADCAAVMAAGLPLLPLPGRPTPVHGEADADTASATEATAPTLQDGAADAAGDISAASDEDIPLLAADSQLPAEEVPAEAEAQIADASAPSPLEPEPEPVVNPTKVITHPVRGGQQIYAQGGDLVVLSSVSPGAELIADGNIHVYGNMRGRAMAGASGDTGARIFMHQLTAELVSIAGCYRVCEDLRRGPQWGTAVAISLDGDVLNITRL